MKQKLILLCLTLLLCGCARQEEPVPAAESAQSTGIPTETASAASAPEQAETMQEEALQAEAVAMAQAPEPAVSVVLEPEASGEREERFPDVVIDYSHTEDGYVMACWLTETQQRLKLRVIGPHTTYTYNLPAEGWTVFPLSDGDGDYQVTVYKNTGGSKYAVVASVQFSVALKDEFAPFLRPNQYVDYALQTNTLDTGAALCTGLTHPLEKVAAVYDFVVNHLTYDLERAETVKSGYIPVLDAVLEEGKGICFDYAALMTAMLRSQQVPCKMVFGYAGSTYHAWISVWTEEDGWIDGVVFFDGHSWKRMDPTFASSSEGNPEVLEFIEHGSYTAKYLY